VSTSRDGRNAASGLAADYARLIADETGKWARTIAALDARVN
jgi:hypothetical protein